MARTTPDTRTADELAQALARLEMHIGWAGVVGTGWSIRIVSDVDADAYHTAHGVTLTAALAEAVRWTEELLG